jgi:hypothetical protein
MSDHDIIGTRPALDLGPLFTQCDVQAAETALREQFVSPPREEVPDPKPALSFRPLNAEERAELRERIKAKVLPDLLKRARDRKNLDENPGVTADDVHELARLAGHDTALGDEMRAWSWVGPWLNGLARRGMLGELRDGGQVVKRASTRDGAHGNPQQVYLDPSDYRAKAVA